MNEDDLMLALHDLMERVEKGSTPSAAYQRMNELLELVAEERGAFNDADDD